MPEAVVEQEATLTLEEVLSAKSAEVSEENTEELEELEEKPEAEEEKQKEVVDPKFEERVQAEADKRVNPYREKREADTALIRRLQGELTEAKNQTRVKVADKLISSILSGDEESGFSEDETKNRELALKEFNKRHEDYKKQSAEVEEAAQFIGDMAEKLPAKVVKGFGLDDPNPSVKARNGAEFLNETAAVFIHNQDFLMAIEEFLPRGDEVRKQIEELVDGMADYESDKAKKLYLADKKKGIKLSLRKSPPLSSEISGGKVVLRGVDALVEGLKEERRKLKIS